MKTKKPVWYGLGGFCLGVLLTALVWMWVDLRPASPATEPAGPAGEGAPSAVEPAGPAEGGSPPADEPAGPNGEAPPPAAGPAEDGTDGAAPVPAPVPPQDTDTWESAAVYTGGDTVSYQGCRYRAKWWTQGETPDSSDVWEDLGIVDGSPVQPAGVDNVPIDAAVPRDTDLTSCKVVGYYPSWKPDKLYTVDFGILTHLCYAFAIPTADGSLRDLESPETAETLRGRLRAILEGDSGPAGL